MRRLLVFAVLLSSSAATAEGRAVPFDSEISGTEVVVFAGDVSPCADWQWKATHVVTGVATHLGKLTGTMTDCLFLTGPATLHFEQGEMTMTAADGDELAATYEGDAAFLDACTVRFVAVMQWQGGTGRFSDATGTAVSIGIIDLCGGDPATNTWEATTEGDIEFGGP
jgi:hypothetical protein